MNLQEHNNNTYTKEKSDIEKYLLRIIQRYFDIENNYTQESIEAIIVQSLTRFKRDILKEKGYIFSLNQMTGNITLTIKDFGGEYKFDKNNAFNKDFGVDEDTICEGNDPRLSDKREPNQHVHIIDDVIGLRELLDSLNISTNTHIHTNKNVLDMLRYSGSLAEFDLQLLEVLCERISKYYSNLEFQRTELSKYSKKQIEILDGCILTIKQDLDNAKLFVTESINWLNSIYKYITDNTDKFYKEQIDKLSEYVTKAKVAAIIEYLKKAYFIVYENEINIQDGEISLTPVEEEYQDIATTDNSSSLENIYNTGFVIGTNDSTGDNRWIWDNSLKSFKYLGNVNDYPMFLNSNAYESYTHRVTLESSDSDDDVISTVIAYDKNTGNHLSVICSCGHVGVDNNINVPSISLQYNYYQSGFKKITNNTAIDSSWPVTKNSDGGGGWASLPNGITVLVKKDKKHIQVWASLNGIGSWIPGADNDIHPTAQPIFDINLDDYTELTALPKKTFYGYGTNSQAYSFYQNVYFLGKYELEYPYGHTNISEKKEIQEIVPSSILNKVNNNKIKMFFRYTKDEKEYQYPLPYCFKDSEGRDIVIQGNYDSNGNIDVQINFINTIPLYCSNLYNDTIIAVTDFIKIPACNVKDNLDNNICVAKIDSVQKEQFITSLINNQELEYLFQGICTTNDDISCIFTDYNNNTLQYVNMINTPSVSDLGMSGSAFMCYTFNDKMKLLDDCTKIIPVILEYKIPRITEYFENPRIYYQVLGNKEGM